MVRGAGFLWGGGCKLITERVGQIPEYKKPELHPLNEGTGSYVNLAQ